MKESIEEPSNGKPSARRRLVMRGAFAAPAALTLFSGGVAARSVTNCATNQVETPVKPPLADQEGTTYVRVQMRKFTAGTSSTKWSRWVPGSAVAAKKAAGQSVFLIDGSWMLYDKGTGSLHTNVGPGGTLTYKPGEGTNTTETGDKWVALRINKNGDIVGVVGINEQSYTSAVWHSCWNSFRLG